LLVVNKPPHWAVQPGSGIAYGNSLIEKVQSLYGIEESSGFKLSLVHRLDKETSGVLLIAKTPEALQFWGGSLRERKTQKNYRTLVIGIPEQEEGTISEKLTKVHSKSWGTRSIIDPIKGKESRTHYRVLEKYSAFTLLDIVLETGRMHQIRTHLAGKGLKILGDSRYGDFKTNRFAAAQYGLKRIFLHSFKLRAFLPNGKQVSFCAPIPDDLEQCLRRIKQHKKEAGKELIF
jgi:23S rRNA pseudouridine955/2504/2580 synthase